LKRAVEIIEFFDLLGEHLDPAPRSPAPAGLSFAVAVLHRSKKLRALGGAPDAERSVHCPHVNPFNKLAR
jgi:hypothetical protein